MSFRRLQTENCLYFYSKDGEVCIISLYVDNLIIAGSTKAVTTMVKQRLSQRYSMKDLGNVDEILGCRVQVNSLLGTVTIQQHKYTAGLLEKYLDTDMKSADTPADKSIILSQSHEPENEEEQAFMATIPYREVIGSLLWLSLGTRPDIAYAVSQVAKFCSNPGPEHWKAVIRILRYLHGTRTLGLTYSADSMDKIEEVTTIIASSDSLVPEGYVDADYARDVESRRSVTGFLFFLAGAPISWQTRQQPRSYCSEVKQGGCTKCL